LWRFVEPESKDLCGSSSGAGTLEIVSPAKAGVRGLA
jgi:hypothetical protein